MAVLGLGSSDYSTFCGAPKKLDKLLSKVRLFLSARHDVSFSSFRQEPATCSILV